MSTPATIADPRRRVLTYDALRTLAILSVVAIHCFMPLRGVLEPHSVALVIDDLLHYAVPLFVFISGALVWGRHRPGGRAAYLSFAKGRIETVALPYLAWATVYLSVALAQTTDPRALAARAPWLLLTGHVWYHLYFIPMLLTFYLLTPVAAPLVRRWPEATVLVVYAVRILLWPPASAWLHGAAPDLVWSYATHLATHLPHMVLGAWFAIRSHAMMCFLRRGWPLLLGAGTAALLARSLDLVDTLPSVAVRLVYPLGMAATILGLVLGVFQLEPYLDRFERRLVGGAALSFGVYFVHPLVLLTLTGVLEACGAGALWRQWWAVPTAWAVVASVSYVAAWALSRSHRTAWLVGLRAGAGG